MPRVAVPTARRGCTPSCDSATRSGWAENARFSESRTPSSRRSSSLPGAPYSRTRRQAVGASGYPAGTTSPTERASPARQRRRTDATNGEPGGHGRVAQVSRVDVRAAARTQAPARSFDRFDDQILALHAGRSTLPSTGANRAEHPGSAPMARPAGRVRPSRPGDDHSRIAGPWITAGERFAQRSARPMIVNLHAPRDSRRSAWPGGGTRPGTRG